MTTRIEIAQSFLALHKNADIDEWIGDVRLTEEEKLEQVYKNLCDDQYGTVQREEDHGFPGEGQIEISQFETVSGHTELFTFRIIE